MFGRIKKRIRSLEDCLGLGYSPELYSKNGTHLSEEFGLLQSIESRLTKIENKLKEKKK